MSAAIIVFFENETEYAAKLPVRIKEQRNGNSIGKEGEGKKLRETEVVTVAREMSAWRTLHPSRLECRLENAGGLKRRRGYAANEPTTAS